MDEYVDVEYNGELKVQLWVGLKVESVEYAISVEEPGYYDLSYRYASDIPSGGGPFF